jgi:hypothetical protein
MTFRGDKYENYRQALLAGGAHIAEVDRVIEDMKAEDAKIDVGICPKRDNSPNARHVLTRTLDPRQAGPTEIAGKWFNYRCACGWFADRCEPVGEN